SEVLISAKPGFSVQTVTVTKGDKVDLRLDNNLPVPHGFSIDAYGIHRVVQPHRPQEFTFKASKTGTFRIYCQLHVAHLPASLLVVDWAGGTATQSGARVNPLVRVVNK